jgi:GntR family transcriptional regulator, transcriptional repressor for pyruvate dehydrogenase complex
MMFRKAKQSRIFQDVVEQIQEAIVSGKLKTGDQLPAERALKERFNISRGTLREALRVLEQKGLIEIRTGVSGGSIVKGVSTEQVSASLALLIRYKKVSLQNLAEFRIGLEGDVAAVAALRATPDDVARLKALLAKASEYFNKGPEQWDTFIRTDEQIHLAIAETTHNPLFISVLASLSHNIHTYYESFLPMEESIIRENHEDIVNLIRAIAAGDPEEARRVAQEHVRRFSSYMDRQGIS